MITMHNGQYLDGEECLQAWSEFGSLAKASEYFYRIGTTNPTTNRPPTRMAISVAAWRWALANPENFEQAKRKYFEPLLLNRGQVWDDERLALWIIKHAKVCFTGKKYTEFLNNFPQFAKYDTIYS